MSSSSLWSPSVQNLMSCPLWQCVHVCTFGLASEKLTWHKAVWTGDEQGCGYLTLWGQQPHWGPPQLWIVIVSLCLCHSGCGGWQQVLEGMQVASTSSSTMSQFSRCLLLLLWSSDASVVVMLLYPVAGLISRVLLLNQRQSPPLMVQISHCSTLCIMCDVPSTAVFCSASIEYFPGMTSIYLEQKQNLWLYVGTTLW